MKASNTYNFIESEIEENCIPESVNMKQRAK